MKYPPQGSRGLSLSRPHTGFVPTDRDRFLAEVNARNLLIVQIESPQAVENVDEILGIPGVDVAFVGCADLSLSMGVSNDPSSGPLRETLELVLRNANRRGIHGGANVTQSNIITALTPRGLRMITVTTDTKGFLDGVSHPLQSIKRS
jgi:2-keto-3-deoxy-L-rhamnonate aldolase RhmA